MKDVYQAVRESADSVLKRIDLRPDVALILGTGLGGVADTISVAKTIPYDTIPHFQVSTAESHAGNLIVGKLGERNILAMQGRFHFYEGYTLQQATFPVRVLRELGAEILVINSAAGALNPLFQSGDVMLITDHINLLCENPLRGQADSRLGERFQDMSQPYDNDLIACAAEAARDLKIAIRHGVYAAVPGPSLETPAETRMLRTLGADAVGMSTAPEAIVAKQVGFRTLAMAAITNVNLPDCMEPISVDKVIGNARLADSRLSSILENLLSRIKDEVRASG
jgi:purine-nucleoside phosphorylase